MKLRENLIPAQAIILVFTVIAVGLWADHHKTSVNLPRSNSSTDNTAVADTVAHAPDSLGIIQIDLGLPADVQEKIRQLLQGNNVLPEEYGRIVGRKTLQVDDVQFNDCVAKTNGRLFPCVDLLGVLAVGDSIRVVRVGHPRKSGEKVIYDPVYYAFSIELFNPR